ncbi:MAG: hypothetical protein LBJ35_04880 [Spirochaetaceae bacterium]|jgi:hypothetical protein|nr:hypothetical protein [Spirochaetaceae bacterium]
MAETTIQPQMGLSFEQDWAALMETRDSIKETERLLKENGAETDRRMKETDRQMKTLQKSMGDLSNRFGELAEHLVVPNIVDKFNALGYHFKDVCRERKLFREDGNAGAEFDILLENGESIVGVEVKSKPNGQDIEDHIERLAFLRSYKDELGDKRKNIYGALAGAIMPDSVRRAALKAGLYVIEQSGDTVKIEKPQQARGWRACFLSSRQFPNSKKLLKIIELNFALHRRERSLMVFVFGIARKSCHETGFCVFYLAGGI